MLASALLLPVFIAGAGLALDRAFSRSQETAEVERLRTQIYLLLGAAEIYGEQIWLPEQLQEPRFNQPDSGLYAQILNNGEPVWQSPSAQATELPEVPNEPEITGAEYFHTLETKPTPMTALSFDVAWDLESGAEKLFRFQVLHDLSAIVAEQKSYRQQLWRWLGGLTLLLFFIQAAVLRWGLKPLKKLARDLGKLDSGEQLTLSENYPNEIKPVIINLNQVLVAERQQRDRYRHTLADLAHSLKTPLAVLQSQADQMSDKKTVVQEQIDRMDDIIRHQLQRSVSRPASLPGKSVALAPVVTRLVSALNKVYADKHVHFTQAINGDCQFRGDEGDLMEVLGNLLDNAYKYGKSRVSISARQEQTLVIEIADDGPGIAQELHQQVLRRGARADTADRGQGIGLSVVVDILSSYRGALTIGQSEMGGALIRIEI